MLKLDLRDHNGAYIVAKVELSVTLIMLTQEIKS